MSCSDVQTIKAGDGSKTQFSFDFPYIFKSEIHVYFWNATTKEYDEKLTTDSTYPWRITDANPTIVEFTSTAPPAPSTPSDPGEPTVDNVKIRRITKVDDIRALFNPGSAIRSDDLNKNFEQLRYAIQESNCQGIPDDVDQYLKDYYWDRYDNTLYDGDTWVSDDTKIATTAAMDARFLDETNETYTKAELAADSNVLPDDDVALPTTGTLKDYVDHAVETDILVNDTGLTKTATGGQVTLGIAEGSVDLDRIKPADIIVSGEANPNNDTTIATTAKIDDMIDAAITGDIAAGNGLSVTDDGDGTITLFIPSNAVDLDRLKNDDIITKTEQDSGSPAAADSNIFTASAAAKRFDTLVQTGTPSESSYEVGKTWLQNDDDQTLKIWNGSTWLDVASGGSFRTQDKVIYVDKTGGDDSKTGHRISGPKLTIKAAINDINADISTSIKTGGSGYADGTYQDVPLTGGTTGSGLTADITVSGGAVTAVTDINASTLEEYQIGDILSAADSNLGNGGGSGFELEVTGGGDGMTVIVAAGIYQEIAPIQIKRRNVSIVGMALRSTIVHPTVATEKPSSNGNSALFELNSGSFIQNLTLTGMQASSSGTNTIDSDLPDKQGWNFAFYDDAFITKSPYIQNCTNFSDSQIDNSDLRAHRPRGGSAGDLTNAPTGGGMLADGSVPKTTSPLRSMVADSYTHVGLNGPGILVTNNGYAQCTSSYAFFNKYHIKTLNGGQANLAASTTDFGEKALVADGKSTSAIFTATVNGAAADGDLTFDIDGVTAGTGWFGDDTKPASNMLVTVNSVTYPILSSTVITGGHRVTVSRPDPNNRSTNLGLNGAVDDDASVEFFLRSQIASSGHTMEYVGSGMDYDALPENGGVPDESAQITELNDGKIWTAITDHNGKFKIGGNQTDDPIFEVDQQLGFVTIPEGSIAFNLLSDLTPQLGGSLDVNGQEIVTDADNENIVLNPHGTGSVHVTSSRIIAVSDPVSAQDAATKSYVDNEVAGLLDDLVDDTTPQLGGDLDVNGNEITSASNGNVTINPNGTGDIVLDANVGIGVSSPNTPLAIASNASTYEGVELVTPSGDGSGVFTFGVHQSGSTAGRTIAFARGGSDGHDTESLRIDASGRLLVGHSSSRSSANALEPHVQIEGINVSTSTAAIVRNENGANGPILALSKSRGTSTGSSTIVQSGDITGAIHFAGADGTDLNSFTAWIQSEVDGTPGSNDMPGRLTFYTTADNASSPTERMRIDSSGRLLLGTTTEGHPNLDDLTIATTGHTGITIRSGTSHDGQIGFSDGTSGDDEYRGQVLYSHNTNSMRFITDAAERMRIDSSGNVGIGTTTPRAKVDFGPGSGDGALSQTLSQYQAVFEAPQGTGDIGRNIAFATTTTGISAAINATDQGGNSATGIAFATGTAGSISEAMRIDSSGRLLVGTTTEGAALADNLTIADSGNCGVTIRSGTTSYGSLYFSDATSGTEEYAGYVEYNHNSNYLNFGVNGSGRMRIDSSGQLLIGETSAGGTCKLGMGFGNSTGNYMELGGTSRTADGTSKVFVFRHGYWGGSQEVASIGVLTSSSGGGAGSGLGNIVFYTGTSGNGDGGSTSAEQMRITYEGAVRIGDSLTSNAAGKLQVIEERTTGDDNDCNAYFETAREDWNIKTYYNRSGTHYHLVFVEQGTERGSIRGNDGSNVTFNQGSDYRWKENIVEMTGTEGIEICKRLKPSKYNWIENREQTGEINTVDGFIAHEVVEAGVLGAVVGEKDAVNEDGSIKGQLLDYGQMTPVLSAGIKGLIAKVETLETQNTAQQAQIDDLLARVTALEAG